MGKAAGRRAVDSLGRWPSFGVRRLQAIAWKITRRPGGAPRLPRSTANEAAEPTRAARREQAARSAGDAVGNAGRAADAAVENADGREGGADGRLGRSRRRDINVDTDHTNKTVVLKGRVKRGAKTLAEQFGEKAVGYRVQNQLTVGQ